MSKYEVPLLLFLEVSTLVLGTTSAGRIIRTPGADLFHQGRHYAAPSAFNIPYSIFAILYFMPNAVTNEPEQVKIFI